VNLEIVTTKVISFKIKTEGLASMDVTIQIPDDIGAALKAQTQAQGVTAARYASCVIEKTLAPAVEPEISTQPFETGYGMWAKYGPAPSIEEIDENRREMSRNFAQDL
jgi:fructose-bisphosphate aldolase class 1